MSSGCQYLLQCLTLVVVSGAYETLVVWQITCPRHVIPYSILSLQRLCRIYNLASAVPRSATGPLNGASFPRLNRPLRPGTPRVAPGGPYNPQAALIPP
jgi:hypothetical protein